VVQRDEGQVDGEAQLILYERNAQIRSPEDAREDLLL
jgi:hypothetical protein